MGWWRVDLATGQTLGMMNNGRGTTATEYAVLGITAISFFVGMLTCIGGGSSMPEEGIAQRRAKIAYVWCCVGVSTAFAVAGLLIGHAITSSPVRALGGGQFGNVTSVTWDIVTYYLSPCERLK